MRTTEPEAKPWNPSIMLIAFIRPAMAKTVNATETSGFTNNWSATGRARRVMLYFVTRQNDSAAPAVAAKRRPGCVFFHTSSEEPTKKAMAPHRPSCIISSRVAGEAPTAASQKPIKSAVPPIRGVSFSWNFCGPTSVSNVKVPCQPLVNRIRPQAATQAANPIHAENGIWAKKDILLQASSGDLGLGRNPSISALREIAASYGLSRRRASYVWVFDNPGRSKYSCRTVPLDDFTRFFPVAFETLSWQNNCLKRRPPHA